MSVRPNKYPQFPFILLDRALDYYSEIANHAHGKGEGGVTRVSKQSSFLEISSFSKIASNLQSEKPAKREIAMRKLYEWIIIQF